MKCNAVNFCRLKQSITYLVYDINDELKGYYTLAFKILDLPIKNLSKNLLKQLERFGQRKDGIIQLPCMILAQWSKNFTTKETINGEDLLSFIYSSFYEVQRLIGGSFAFIEC